jgi:hypothetical protein
MIQLNLRSMLALGMAISLGLAIGCSSRGDDDIEATTVVAGSTVEPTQVAPLSSPVRTARPTSSATPITSPASPPSGTSTPFTVPAEPPIDVSLVTVPVCRTTDRNSNGVGFGTIPHATPTAIPGQGSSITQSTQKATEFAIALKPLIDAVVAVTEAADRSWGIAEGSEDLGRVILFEGRRLSQLCSALSVVPLTTNGKPFVDTMADNLKARRDLLYSTAELGRDDSANLRALDADRTDSSLTLKGLEVNLDEFSTLAGVTSVASVPFTIVNPLLAVTFGAPAGWLMVRNGIDIVLLAPAEQQVYSARGLGPDAWKLGSALRVRRFRNAESADLSGLSLTLDALYAQFGGRVAVETSRFGSIDGVLGIYRDVERGWDTLVSATVIDDSTYLFELGCPDEINSVCISTINQFVASVEFING